MISTSETYQHQGSDMGESYSYGGQPRPRHDSSPLVMLPAPLAVNRGPTGISATSTSGFSRNSEEIPMLGGETSSRSRLIPSPPGDYGAYSPPESFSPTPPIENYVNRAGYGAGGSVGGPVLRQGTVSTAYPGETQNPYRQAQPQTAGYDEETSVGTTESDDTQSSSGPMGGQQSPPQQYQLQQRARTTSRGVALQDNGVVPGPEGHGVRRLARPQARRPSSQQPPTNRYSRTSMYGPQLPPGAAPPRPYGDYQ